MEKGRMPEPYPYHHGAVSWKNMPSPRPCRLLSRWWQYQKLKKALQAAPLFDAAFYVANDQALREKGENPLWHYCRRGFLEGRNPSPYFFGDWYLAEYPDVAASGMNPLLHYLLSGAQEGKNPNPYFLSAWYQKRYPEARTSGLNPLWHYIRQSASPKNWPNPYFDPLWYAAAYPQAAGSEALAHFLQHGPEFCFQPNPHFDGVWYLKSYPQVEKMGLHPLQHYLSYGREQACDPNPLFDSRWYEKAYPEAETSGLLPLGHFLQHHEELTVNPNPYFDARWYLEQYPEVAKAGLDPVLHYAIFGVKESRDPGPWFCTAWYLWKYPEVTLLNMKPLVHYMRIGVADGREASPFFDASWYAAQYPEGKNSGLPPLLHFLCVGRKEGKLPCAPAEMGKRGSRYLIWNELFFGQSEEDRALLQRHIREFSQTPLISVVMPVYNSNEAFLRAAIDSVLAQAYPHWELCIADDASSDPQVRGILRAYQEKDRRIKVMFREEHGHISKASNSALALAKGEFIALLDHDDLLSEDALFWVAEAINRHPDAGLLYSDEDKIDSAGLRQDPYFKCDWDPFLFCGHNMISHLGVYRKTLVESIGGFRAGYEGAQDYDLAARAVEHVDEAKIIHIPRVLYHWRISESSTAANAEAKPYAHIAALKAVNEHLSRLGMAARVEDVPEKNRTCFLMQGKAEAPLVSIIIPTRNRADLVRTSIDSIIRKTAYSAYEIMLVDNGSDEAESLACFQELARKSIVRLLRDNQPFNYSRLNNRAVAEAKGELVLLLNNDTEVIAPDWLEQMVRLAMLPQVGAVGAKLLYSNKNMQHAGVVLGINGGAAHIYKDFPEEAPGYWKQALLTRRYSAVTGACLAVRRKLYEEAGGLDEQCFPVGYNDVDFCLKLRARGYKNVWTPQALLYHHESVSRGVDASPEKKRRFWNEMSLLKKRWPNVWYHDPAYNPNLSASKADCGRSMQPRVVLNCSHWPKPFAPSYIAPISPTPRLLLVVPEQARDARCLAFARELLQMGLIHSYAAAGAKNFYEVSAEADGWFDLICLAGAPQGLMWFERGIMKWLPVLLDVETTAPFRAAAETGPANTVFQALVHAAVVTASEESFLPELEALYGLNLSACGEQVQRGEARRFFVCLMRAKMDEPLPACRVRFL